MAAPTGSAARHANTPPIAPPPRRLRFWRTLAFRLIFWYAAAATLSAGGAFLLAYHSIGNLLRERIDQELLSEEGTFATLMAGSGIEAVQRLALAESQAAGERQFFFRLLYPSGVAFSSSNMAYWHDIGVDRNAVERLLAGERHVFATVAAPGRGGRIRLLYSLLGVSTVLQLGQSLESDVRFGEAARRIFGLALALLLIASVLLGLFMARKALGGVADVTRTARRIAEGRLESRVEVRRRYDEIEQLADTFNRMLDRIQELVSGMREMSDNIAHDLKSPVARIRGMAEVSLATAASRDETNAALGSVVEECDRLLEMINTMLLISRTEAGVAPLTLELLDLGALLREACALFEVAAEDRDLTLSCQAETPLPLWGDRRLLQRLVANLLDNALAYTPAGGRIEADVRRSGAELVLSVADSGPGIAAHDLPHIFERFYRGDPSRTVAGAGLGLSLARAVCQAHHGTIGVESAAGQGACFTVRLPASAQSGLKQDE